jgi:HlyD family secretion protein
VRQAESDLEASRAQIGVQQATVAARRADLSRAMINLEEARRDFDRKSELVARNFISPAERDRAAALVRTVEQEVGSARAQVDLAEASVRNAQATVRQREAQLASSKVDLGRTVIRAPVDGVVIKRSIELGQTVAASLQSPELFVIAQNLHDMQVEVSIDEAEVSRVRVGQKTTFTVDAFPGRTFEGNVRQVRKAAQNTQNVITYTAVVATSNDSLALLPGMTANVRIVTDVREAALKLPNAALRFRPPGFTDAAQKKAAASSAPMAVLDAARAAARGIEWLLPTARAQAQGSAAPGAASTPGAPARPAGAGGAPPSGAAEGTAGGAGGAAALRAFRERLIRDLNLSDSQRTQLDAIFAGMRDRFVGARDAPEADRAKLAERNRAEMRARINDILDEPQKKKYADILAELAGRNAARGRVFVPGADGKPQPLEVRLGLSDGTATELLGVVGEGKLAEGDLVIVGIQAAPSSGTGGQRPSGAPRLPF